MKATTRREFIKQAGTIGACICCLGTPGLLSSCGTTKAVAITTETENNVVIPTSMLGETNYTVIKTKKFDQPLYIAKKLDGSYTALLLLCTHKGCGLRVAPDKLVCPCHASEFSTEGAVLTGPAKNPLRTFSVTIEQQNVIVHFN